MWPATTRSQVIRTKDADVNAGRTEGPPAGDWRAFGSAVPASC